VKQLAVLLLVLLVASCSGGGGGDGGAHAPSSAPPITARRDASREPLPAIRVGSTVISFAQAEDELDNIGRNRAYLAHIQPTLEAAGGSVLFKDGFDQDFARMTLTRLVQFTLVHDSVMARGVTLTDDCKALAARVLPGELTGSDQATGRALLAGFTPAYQSALEQRRTELAALMSSLAGVPCDQTVPLAAGATTTIPASGAPSDSEARQRAQQAYQSWYQDRLATTPIQVDPSIGTFVASAGRIVPSDDASPEPPDGLVSAAPSSGALPSSPLPPAASGPANS
jgi:hypothetical protein